MTLSGLAEPREWVLVAIGGPRGYESQAHLRGAKCQNTLGRSNLTTHYNDFLNLNHFTDLTAAVYFVLEACRSS